MFNTVILYHYTINLIMTTPRYICSAWILDIMNINLLLLLTAPKGCYYNYSVIGVPFIYVAMLLSCLCRVSLSASDPPKLCGAASRLTWLE